MDSEVGKRYGSRFRRGKNRTQVEYIKKEKKNHILFHAKLQPCPTIERNL